MNSLKAKIAVVVSKIFYYFLDFPIRVRRLLLHFLWFSSHSRKHIPQLSLVNNFFEWLLFIPFYLIDLSGLVNLYEIISELVFINTRFLTRKELLIGHEIFKESLDYKRIRINDSDHLIAKKLNIAYVSFNSINCGRPISDQLLVHELIHIWQYHQFGAVYIYKALMAQRSREGYNYGGLEAIGMAKQKKIRIYQFNFEQQGDIVQDYFLLKRGKRPYWIPSFNSDINLFDFLIADLHQLRSFPRIELNKPVA